MAELRLTVLVDNTAGPIGYAEHGLSLYLECNNEQFLFDVGASELFINNAELLGIDIESVKTIILSHGHWDHGNGLTFIKDKTIITHPDSFMKRYRKSDKTYIGLSKNKIELQEFNKVRLSNEPVELSRNLWFLGEIPRLNDFEAKTTGFVKENSDSDFVIDDSAIVYSSKKGLIIISGCAHAGICNTIEYAKKITKQDIIHAVIGGFHLKEIDEQIIKTRNFFEQESIKELYPMHCTGFEAKAYLHNSLSIASIQTGDTLLF